MLVHRVADQTSRHAPRRLYQRPAHRPPLFAGHRVADRARSAGWQVDHLVGPDGDPTAACGRFAAGKWSYIVGTQGHCPTCSVITGCIVHDGCNSRCTATAPGRRAPAPANEEGKAVTWINSHPWWTLLAILAVVVLNWLWASGHLVSFEYES
jgi:hypothetical protein